MQLARVGPDYLMDELTATLTTGAWFEFKPLYTVIHAQLRERKQAHCGDEMLRLRAYEKLQSLVQRGYVEKSGKQYRGIPTQLAKLQELTAAQQVERVARRVRAKAPARARVAS